MIAFRRFPHLSFVILSANATLLVFLLGISILFLILIWSINFRLKSRLRFFKWYFHLYICLLFLSSSFHYLLKGLFHISSKPSFVFLVKLLKYLVPFAPNSLRDCLFKLLYKLFSSLIVFNLMRNIRSVWVSLSNAWIEESLKQRFYYFIWKQLFAVHFKFKTKFAENFKLVFIKSFMY